MFYSNFSFDVLLVWLLLIIFTFLTVIGATEYVNRRDNDAKSIKFIFNHPPSFSVTCAASDAHHALYSSYVVITAHWNLYLI